MLIKTKDELNKIKTAAKINTECIFYLKDLVEPGVSSFEIDKKAEEFYTKNKVRPAFKGYMGYPTTINFMLNDQVVHCIPSKNQIVSNGDIVSIDTGCIYEGFFADQATSFGVGEITQEDEKLLNIAQLSVEAGCNQAIVGKTIGDIGYAQQTVIEMAGFSVVRKYVGHEIGKNLHDPIKLPAFGSPNSGNKLQKNLVLAVENQTCAGSYEVITEKDGWSVRTKDGKHCATFEHMVIVKKNKPEILTRI